MSRTLYLTLLSVVCFTLACFSDAIILNNSFLEFSICFFIDKIYVFKPNRPPQIPISNCPTFYKNSSSVVNLVSLTKCLPGSPLKMSMCSHCLHLLLLSLTSNLWGILPTVPAKTVLIQTSHQPHLCNTRGEFNVSSSAQGTTDGSCFLKFYLVSTLSWFFPPMTDTFSWSPLPVPSHLRDKCPHLPLL